VVIGVHSPEFAFEKNVDNVKRAIGEPGIDYPVAIDNDHAILRAFQNQYWPAHYFIDAEGRIRHHHLGEGEYDQSEKIIQELLKEAGQSGVSGDLVSVDARGAEAAADTDNVKSPETYVGYARAANFVADGGVVGDMPHFYAIPPQLQLNQWGLVGGLDGRRRACCSQPSQRKHRLPFSRARPSSRPRTRRGRHARAVPHSCRRQGARRG
jgi:hypothetical protein